MASQRLLLLALLVTILSVVHVCAWPPSKNGGWTSVTSDVSLGIPGRVIGVADWTNDKEAGLVVVDENNTVSIYNWAQGTHNFWQSLTFPFGDEGIVSAITADINRDGMVDLALTTTKGKLHIIYGPGRVAYDIMPNIPLHPSIPHLNALNLYGSCALVDLVVVTSAGYLTILRNQLGSVGGCDYIGGNATFIAESNVSLAYPELAMSVGAVDFNGDCLTDFIGPDQAQNEHSTTYSIRDVPDSNVRQQLTVPDFFGTPTYADIDGDGAVDIVFPACMKPILMEGSTTHYTCAGYNALAIIFNVVSGAICGSDSCCAGHGSYLGSVAYTNETGNTNSGSWQLLAFNCQSQSPFELKAGEQPQEDAQLINTSLYPAVIRLLDWNRDTLVDMVVATTWGPMVLTNNDGSLICNALDIGVSRSSTAFRNSIPFPFDLDEDGIVDILTFSLDTNGTIGAYWNGYGNEENYFFTATMLNGVSAANYPSWGAVQIGAVHRFQWQDVDTKTRTGTATQYASSAAHSLVMPHAHFGLARTFSPIQNYGTGVRNGKGDYYRDWTAYLMPNSQVVVLAHPIDDPSQWSIRLFLYSLQFKQIIIIALPTVLAIIGIPILVLKCREMQFDKAEKRQQMS